MVRPMAGTASTAPAIRPFRASWRDFSSTVHAGERRSLISRERGGSECALSPCEGFAQWADSGRKGRSAFFCSAWRLAEGPFPVFAMNDHVRTDSGLGWCQGADRAAQVIGATRQHDLSAVSSECVEAHSPQAVAFLEDGKRSFDSGANAGDQPVASFLPRRQLGMMLVRPLHQPILDAGLHEPRMPRVRVVGLIAIHRLLIAADQ